VIIIFLNAGQFLEEAIESVFAQSFGDWELLLVDDGSTDGSTRLARDFAERYAGRVRYLEHPGHRNRGMSASRNLGIANASGEYLALLDADDVWLPAKLERHVAALDRHADAAMVYGAPLYWYSWTDAPGHGSRDEAASLVVPADVPLDAPGLFLKFLARSAPPPWPSDVLIRREVATAVGGFEDAFRGMYEDQAFFAKILLSQRAVASSECSMKYRQHRDACYIVAKRTGTHHEARRFYLLWLRRYLAEAGISDPEIWRTLERQLRPHRLSRRIVRHGQRLVQRVVAAWGAADGRPAKA
jgi:glycosyltransferase involved in cell wall biosynthesis